MIRNHANHWMWRFPPIGNLCRRLLIGLSPNIGLCIPFRFSFEWRIDVLVHAVVIFSTKINFWLSIKVTAYPIDIEHVLLNHLTRTWVHMLHYQRSINYPISIRLRPRAAQYNTIKPLYHKIDWTQVLERADFVVLLKGSGLTPTAITDPSALASFQSFNP